MSFKDIITYSDVPQPLCQTAEMAAVRPSDAELARQILPRALFPHLNPRDALLAQCQPQSPKRRAPRDTRQFEPSRSVSQKQTDHNVQTMSARSTVAKSPAVTSPHHTSLSQIKSLEELKATMEGFEKCALKKLAQNTVFADGNPQAPVMLIGEAPGAEEDARGLPFVGLSGQLLDRMLAAISLDRQQVYISNIVPWRPPGNRQPSADEIALCLPFILRHIELVAPRFLVCLGGTATKSLLHVKDGLARLRGRWHTLVTPQGMNIPTLVTFHPAYLLRSPGQKREAWRDLLMLKMTVAGEGS